ncbi:MAG: DUF455 family protein [Verrucomicrobiales bacterium]|nr:DUF455 family protein [Verrucomicrobiales bacterium]
MELRDFAESVLFARTLEEKLHCPGTLTDERPGPALSTPGAPGRPNGLAFKPTGTGAGSEVPPDHRLHEDRERGRLLHFFCNHELLATELMALVLLRFPDAPPAFRRGVAQTLRDEQEHTRMYLRRMRDCGIEFGELPVSGYFWRVVSPMASPLDFVTSLSLTFEQANLDFCRHFAHRFTEAGDAETARLLDGIYRDEIAHVAHGLKWFRRWKDPRDNDWDAFCRQLRFPLSPTRARGIGFNAEGRRAAGLDSGFIANLNVHSASKGRTPGIFVFNPFAEEFVGRGPGFVPSGPAAQLARDLSNLPQFLARQDDVVLVERPPSVAFLSSIKDAGFALPEFVMLEHGRLRPGDPLLERKIGSFRPWAWSPDSAELLAPLHPQLTGPAKGCPAAFDPRRGDLYSKAWSAAFLKEFLREWDTIAREVSPGVARDDWLCPTEVVGSVVGSEEEVLKRREQLRETGYPRIVIKEPFGLAGRNVLRLADDAPTDAQRRWLRRALALGHGVVVEPWLDRRVDFSVQMELGPQGLRLIGFTGLLNDDAGRFRANWAGPKHHRKPPEEVLRLLPEPGALNGRIGRLYAVLAEQLEPRLRSLGHSGPLGVDAFVYRSSDGRCRLKPIVEINPRFTMGRVTLEILRQAAPGCAGVFRLLSQATATAAGCPGFLPYATLLAQQFPLVLGGEPIPKIRSGVLCLNDPAQAESVLAVAHIGPHSPADSVLPGMAGMIRSISPPFEPETSV